MNRLQTVEATRSKSVKGTAGKVKAKRSRAHVSPTLVREYQRYFVAPTSTPDSFKVLDLTDGASFSFTSHT